jgi:hypothetical protein
VLWTMVIGLAHWYHYLTQPPKKFMPYPQVMWGNSFKHDGRHTMITPGVLPFPCYWIVFPLPVHVVNTSQHTREPTSLSYMKQPLNVFSSGLS